MHLAETIQQLINLKQEGGYWDFKRQWYDSDSARGDLLIDILCMANNLENRDAYIIIGVDESDDYNVRTVANDPNRRNTQNLVDFLKGKNFMGDIRPLATVTTISIDNAELDIIVIKNSYDTPFVLTSDYQGIKAHHTYTRVQDVNTARTSSADVDKIEQLYRKRFRISEAPLERVEYYLNNLSGWEEVDTGVEYEFYYKHAPDQFVIRFKSNPDDERCEFWSLMFPASGRHNNRLGAIEITWNGLVLSSNFQYAPLDDARAYCVMPKMGFIKVNNKYYRYFYLIKGTMQYSLYNFVWSKLHHNGVERYRGAIENHFIIFEDTDQQRTFHTAIEQQKETIAAALDAERSSPANAHLQSPGFYYGFTNIDVYDYLDSKFFVSKFKDMER